MLNTVVSHAAQTIKRNLFNIMTRFQSPQLSLAPAAISNGALSPSPSSSLSSQPSLADCLWLAVPKRKVSRQKKRMKTTNQKRIKTKTHIIVDSRTGEMTLRHRLPFNWKDYIQE